jgi:hypothetical protein
MPGLVEVGPRWSSSGVRRRALNVHCCGSRRSPNPPDADARKQIGSYVTEKDFSVKYETVDWSQARYDDYGFVALDVTPARKGERTTMVLRFINEQGLELDRVVFSRTAGTGR